jgi:hypothetical protein
MKKERLREFFRYITKRRKAHLEKGFARDQSEERRDKTKEQREVGICPKGGHVLRGM